MNTKKWVVILEITDKSADTEFALTPERIRELVGVMAFELPGRAGLQVRRIEDVSDPRSSYLLSVRP